MMFSCLCMQSCTVEWCTSTPVSDKSSCRPFESHKGIGWPFCSADMQFYLKVVLVLKIIALTCTVTLNSHFLIAFQSLEIASWKCFDIFLKPSAAWSGAEWSFCLLRDATTFEESGLVTSNDLQVLTSLQIQD